MSGKHRGEGEQRAASQSGVGQHCCDRPPPSKSNFFPSVRVGLGWRSLCRGPRGWRCPGSAVSPGMGSPRARMWGQLGALRPGCPTTRWEKRVRESLSSPVPSQIHRSLPPEIARQGGIWGPGRTERGGEIREGGGIPFAPPLFSSTSSCPPISSRP